jgi:hypothetical protein
MSHYSVGGNSNMGVLGVHPSNMQLSYYGGINPGNCILLFTYFSDS